MPARVNDDLVNRAAEALVDAAKSMTNKDGLAIRCPMDIHKAKSAVMASLVNALGYPNSIMPTGWTEVSNFGVSHVKVSNFGASHGA